MTRKLTALTATLTLLATGCSASTDNTAPTGSPVATSTPSTTTAPSTATRTPTVTEVSPTTATPTPTVSLDPSPLAGAGGGPQQPSSEAVLTSITDEDRARAVDAAKAIITAYTSGKPYKEWSAELFPLIDPELQNEYDSKFRVDLLKGTVTGAEITHDPTTDIPGGDNPYWITVRVKVDGGISPEYYVRLHRTSERPNKWKASHILEPQAFNSFVNNKLKNRK
jgi:carbonate dehydratase